MINEVRLIGRLTKDPELKYTQTNSHSPYCFVTLAVDTGYNKENKKTLQNLFQ